MRAYSKLSIYHSGFPHSVSFYLICDAFAQSKLTPLISVTMPYIHQNYWMHVFEDFPSYHVEHYVWNAQTWLQLLVLNLFLSLERRWIRPRCELKHISNKKMSDFFSLNIISKSYNRTRFHWQIYIHLLLSFTAAGCLLHLNKFVDHNEGHKLVFNKGLEEYETKQYTIIHRWQYDQVAVAPITIKRQKTELCWLKRKKESSLIFTSINEPFFLFLEIS